MMNSKISKGDPHEKFGISKNHEFCSDTNQLTFEHMGLAKNQQM